MNISSNHGGQVILISLLIAFILSTIPLPEEFRFFRPQWVQLVIIYWIMALPHRVGVISAFVSGLILDIMLGTLLGQHAFSLSLIAYLVLLIHQRVRVYPLWQQSLSVLVFLLLDSLIARWVLGLNQRPVAELSFWVTPLIGALLWPWIYIVLRDARRRFHVK